MIEYIVIGILSVLLITFISFFIIKSKKVREKDNRINEIIENKDKELEENWNRKNEELKEQYDGLNQKLDIQLSSRINEIDKMAKQRYEELFNEKEDQVKIAIEREKNLLILRMQRDLDQAKESKQREINDTLKTAEAFSNQRIEELNERTKWYEDQSAEAAQEYCEILDVLEDFRARREVVNSQILREKEIQEKEDFYRICLSDNDIEDLKIIKEIEHKFNNKEVLNRAAFDCYVRRPLSEMEKRVLGSRKVCGIYIITYIPTGEIYIGKSVDITNRWQEHVKSAFNLGNIASSSLHVKMQQKGVWNFTFQVLEEVPKEKLSEREKYWISLYGATDLINQKQGG